MNYQKGQVGMAAIIIAGVFTLGASAFTAWATAGGRVNAIDVKLERVIEREGNHYIELQRNLVRIEGKLDELLGR